MINKPMPQVRTSQPILVAALTLLSIAVTAPTSPLVIECHHLTPAIPDPITTIAFRFPSSVAALPTVRSGVQRRTITELLKDARAPLTNLFLMESMKIHLMDSPRVAE